MSITIDSISYTKGYNLAPAKEGLLANIEPVSQNETVNIRVTESPNRKMSDTAKFLIGRVSGSEFMSNKDKYSIIKMIATLDATNQLGEQSGVVNMLISLSEQSGQRNAIKNQNPLEPDAAYEVYEQQRRFVDRQKEQSYTLSVNLLAEQLINDPGVSTFDVTFNKDNTTTVDFTV